MENVVTVFGLAFAGVLDFFKLLFKFLDALTDHAAVGFELRFAGALGADASVVLTAKVRPCTGQARHHVLELRYFDHQAAFCRNSVLRENVQDKPCTVEYLDSGHSLFQVPNLRTGQIVVENHHLGVLLFQGTLDLVHLAFTNERCRAKVLHPL